MSTPTITRGLGPFLLAFACDKASDVGWNAMLVWAAAHSGSPGQAGLIVALGVIPQLLSLPLGGVVGDRFGLTSVIRYSLVVRALLLVAAGMVFLTQLREQLAVLALLALVWGFVDGLHDPAMEGSATLLGDESNESQGLIQTRLRGFTQAAGVAGALTVGALIVWSLSGAAWAVAVLAAIAAAAASRAAKYMRPPERQPSSPTLHQVREGFGAARSSPTAKLVLGVMIGANLFATPIMQLGIPLRAADEGWSGLTFGCCLAAAGAGAVVGSFARDLKLLPQRTVSLAGAASLLIPTSACLGAVALSTGPVATGIAAAAGSFLVPPAVGPLMGGYFTSTPKALRGRMQALARFAQVSLTPVGLAAFGASVGLSSLRVAGLVFAAAVLVVGLLAASKFRALERRSV